MTSDLPDRKIDLDEPADDEWQFISCMPLERAAARLNAAQQVLPTVYVTAEQLVASAYSDAAKLVRDMRKDPEWHLEADNTEEGLEYHLAMTSYELPLMLIGQMIVFPLSILETALSEVGAVAASMRGIAEPASPKGPKLEGHIKMLSDVLGVEVDWSVTTWRQLRMWRKRRNSFVHGLDLSLDAKSRRELYVLEGFWGPGELPTLASVQQLLQLIGTALGDLDESIHRIWPR